MSLKDDVDNFICNETFRSCRTKLIKSRICRPEIFILLSDFRKFHYTQMLIIKPYVFHSYKNFRL
jgi:hypothetical protein